MTGESGVEQRFYQFHGVGLTVAASDPAVLEAMDLRFRDFRSERSPLDGLRFEFVSGSETVVAPAGNSRPVYDTPYGSLHYFPEADAVFGELAGVRLRCEPARGAAWLHCAEFTGSCLYLATHPLATIALMELLERRGLFSLHAGCLATDDGHGVLLAGPSGAGKSTLALALARAGMGFLADDVVFLIREAGGIVRMLGFADALGLTEYAGTCFPELGPSLEEPVPDGFPKLLLRVEDLLGTPALPTCAPHVVVFPQVAPEEPSSIAALDPREAMLRLVPDVLLTEPGATQAHLAAVGALLDQVRCYELRSGTDLGRASELIRELM